MKWTFETLCTFLILYINRPWLGNTGERWWPSRPKSICRGLDSSSGFKPPLWSFQGAYFKSGREGFSHYSTVRCLGKLCVGAERHPILDSSLCPGEPQPPHCAQASGTLGLRWEVITVPGCCRCGGPHLETVTVWLPGTMKDQVGKGEIFSKCYYIKYKNADGKLQYSVSVRNTLKIQ